MPHTPHTVEESTANPLVEWDEIKFFVTNKGRSAVSMMERARTLSQSIKEMESELSSIKKTLAPFIDMSGATRVKYEDVEFRMREGYERRSLDTSWAQETLIKKGIPIAEIKKHTKVSKIKPAVGIYQVKQEREEEGDE